MVALIVVLTRIVYGVHLLDRVHIFSVRSGRGGGTGTLYHLDPAC